MSDNKDPDELNRVRVTILGEQEAVSNWLPVISPSAGSDTGVSMLPDVDDEVLIVSMSGNNLKMAVLGSSWFADGTPPVTGENSDADLNGDGKNSLKFMKSREKLQFITGDGKTRFEFDTAGEIGNLTSEQDVMIGAKGSLTLKAESISIQSEKSIEISGEEYAVSAKKAADITSDKDMTMKGSGIALN